MLLAIQCIHCTLIIQPHYRVKQLLWKLQFFTGEFFGNTWIAIKPMQRHFRRPNHLLIFAQAWTLSWRSYQCVSDVWVGHDRKPCKTAKLMEMPSERNGRLARVQGPCIGGVGIRWRYMWAPPGEYDRTSESGGNAGCLCRCCSNLF